MRYKVFGIWYTPFEYFTDLYGLPQCCAMTCFEGNCLVSVPYWLVEKGAETLIAIGQLANWPVVVSAHLKEPIPKGTSLCLKL